MPTRDEYYANLAEAKSKIGTTPELYIKHNKTGQVVDLPTGLALTNLAQGTHSLASPEDIEKYKAGVAKRTAHLENVEKQRKNPASDQTAQLLNAISQLAGVDKNKGGK